jgi:hypothetical protein
MTIFKVEEQGGTLDGSIIVQLGGGGKPSKERSHHHQATID